MQRQGVEGKKMMKEQMAALKLVLLCSLYHLVSLWQLQQQLQQQPLWPESQQKQQQPSAAECVYERRRGCASAVHAAPDTAW